VDLRLRHAVLMMQVETPGYIVYHTPKEGSNTSTIADDVQGIIPKVDCLDFMADTESTTSTNPTDEEFHLVLDKAFATVANMAMQFGLPNFTKKDLLEIIRKSEGVAAAMALAIKADYMSDDITAYLDVIDQISQREEQASLGICQLLCGFAKMASCDYSIPIYRQVIIQIASHEGSTQESKTESVLKIAAMEELASALFRNKQYTEAESMFCDASELFQKLGYPAYSFNCQLRQAQFLQEVGQHYKASSLLLSLLVYRLELDQSTFDIMDVALRLSGSYMALRLHTSFTNITLHREWSEVIFSEVIFRPYKLGDWSKVNSRLNDLGRIAKSSSNIYDTTSPIIMEAVILIADALSFTDEFEKANSLLLVALAKANQWAIDDDSKYNKAFCNYIYAKNLSQQRNHSKAALHLIAALETLMSIGRDGEKLASSARQRLDWSYAELMSSVGTNHGQIIDAITEIKALLIERNDTLSPKSSTLVGSGTSGFIIFDEEDSSEHSEVNESEVKLTTAALQRLDGVTLDKLSSSKGQSEVQTTTTRSYKYGVTFSVSDITGISLSEFFVS
jgi:tetratricopeptide (TPR) repeat protein